MERLLKKLDNRLFLIGVAHVLPKSTVEVERAIAEEKPDIVAVELCPARYLALTRGLKRPSILGTMRAGRVKLSLLNSLLYLLQKKFSQQTGMPAGEEMLVAIRHAQKIGARVELIDRDISITLQRLIDRMSRWEKLRLVAELLLGLLPFGKRVELERLTDDQIVAYLLNELKLTSPTAYQVLIRERDAYMASRVAMLLSASTGKVVCVVGAGHVPGIYERLSRGISGSWRMSTEYRVG